MFRKLCCFCRIKGKKSESNSQQTQELHDLGAGCFCRIKGKKSESNSQRLVGHDAEGGRCFCRIKGKKSESNSQRLAFLSSLPVVVSAVSKVRNLKAIHNLKASTVIRW